MGMDVTDLKSGISEANKQIQLANSQFKAASSGMDDWTKSTEGITAKVKQLDSVLKMQKSKLAGLTAEYEKVAKEQGEGSEAARRLRVQINNQQAVVNKTQKEFNNYSDILKQAEAGTLDLSQATIKANGELKEMGDSAADAGGKVEGGFGAGVAKGIAGGIAAIGAAAIGAVGAFLSLSESTRETRENMNKLETGFTVAGHSAEDATETYKALYGVLGDEGQATEAAAHLAQLANNQEDLSKWTDIATGVYATFGDSLPIENLTEAANETAKTGKITGGLADALNWAGVSEEGFQAQLDATTSEQERQALITETLNGLYSEQSDKFKELNGDIIKAREADAALSQAMAELGAIAEPIMTTLKLLAVDLLENIKPFVELIGSGLTGALNGTAGATDQLAEGLGGVISAVVGKITEALPTALSMLTQLVPSLLATLSQQLPSIIAAITDFLPQIVTALLNMLPTLLSTLVDLSVQIINAVSTILPQLVSAIMEILPQLINQLIASIPQLLQAAVTLLMAIVNALPTIITSLIAALPSVITTIINALIQSIPILLDAAIQLLNAIIDAIPVILRALIINLPKIIDAIINGVLDALPLLLDAAITLLFALIDAIPVIVQELNSAMPDIIEAILKAVARAIPKLFSTAKELLGKILEAAGDLIRKLPSKMGEVITAIIGGLTKGISKVKTVGKDIIEGLWDGIKDMSDWIAKKIKGFGEDVLGGIKDFFGIKSPSRVMKKEVGGPIAEGVAEGIEEKADVVGKATEKLGVKALTAAKGMTSKMTIASATMSAKLLELEKDYTEKTAAVWEKSNEDIAAATEKYEDNLAKRAAAISSSMNLLDQVVIEDYNGREMTRALESQVKALETYQARMDALKNRGIDAGLYEELQNMGVAASDAIAELTRMSDAQLERYVELWRKKTELAHNQAEAELLPDYQNQVAQIKEAADAEITAINAEYATELQALADEFVSIVELATEAGAVLSTEQIAQYNELGKNLMLGIADGFASEQDGFISSIQTVIDDAVAAAQQAADIHSPSKLFRDKVGVFLGEGIGVGILDSMPTVKKNLGEFTKFIQSNIGNIKSGLTLDTATAGAGASSAGSRNTVVNAGLTVNYNGKMSRKQVKKTEDNHYKSIRMKLKAEGAI